MLGAIEGTGAAEEQRAGNGRLRMRAMGRWGGQKVLRRSRVRMDWIAAPINFFAGHDELSYGGAGQLQGC